MTWSALVLSAPGNPDPDFCYAGPIAAYRIRRWGALLPKQYPAGILVSMCGKILFGFLALLASFLAGCSTVESRIQSNPQLYGSLSPTDQALVRQGQIRQGMSKAAVFLAWDNPDRIRAGYRLGHPFEAWVYTTTRTTLLPDYYYYPGFYRFGYFRGGLWRHHHHFYSFGLYSYPFDPYPDIVSYEVPYKIVYFEGDRCTGWEYLTH
jgi:hypothetical protein